MVSFSRIKTLGKVSKLLTCYFGIAKLDSVPNCHMLKFFGLPPSSVVIPSVPNYPASRITPFYLTKLIWSQEIV